MAAVNADESSERRQGVLLPVRKKQRQGRALARIQRRGSRRRATRSTETRGSSPRATMGAEDEKRRAREGRHGSWERARVRAVTKQGRFEAPGNHGAGADPAGKEVGDGEAGRGPRSRWLTGKTARVEVVAAGAPDCCFLGGRRPLARGRRGTPASLLRDEADQREETDARGRGSAAGEARLGSSWRRAQARLKSRWTWAATGPVSGETQAHQSREKRCRRWGGFVVTTATSQRAATSMASSAVKKRHIERRP